MDPQKLICPVCSHPSTLLDVVDFNKACLEMEGKFLPLLGEPVYYALCSHCDFCYAPEMLRWTRAQFAERIYNDDYLNLDPDYADSRPHSYGTALVTLFKGQESRFRHLDYGGGNGKMSALLREAGWNSTSYDPFVDDARTPQDLGKFDLITAVEVFEHATDVMQLMRDLKQFLSPNGIIIFSTQVSDQHIKPRKRIDWWYVSPCNGHISIYARKTLAEIAQRHDFHYKSFNEGLHLFHTEIPSWIAHLIR